MKIVFNKLDKYENLKVIAKLTNDKRQLFKDFFMCETKDRYYFFMPIKSISDISLISTRLYLFEDIRGKEENFLNNSIFIIYCDDNDIIEIIKERYGKYVED